jgi:hypothetical protein
MTSRLTAAAAAIATGNPRAVIAGNEIFSDVFNMRDLVTVSGSESADDVVYLFGGAPNMEGITLIPEQIQIRTGGTTGTISYVGKLQRVNAAGTVVDITGTITLNRTKPTVAAAVVTPQVPLAAGERIRLILTTVTTAVAGVTWEINIPAIRVRAPGQS